MGLDIDSPDLAPLKSGLFWQAAFKLDWADDQFLQALYLLDTYTQNGGTGIRERYEAESSTYVTELFAERLPRQIALFIGTGIHSLRSALDTAVSMIVREAGGKQDMRVAFPFHSTESGLRASFEPGRRTCPDCGNTRNTKASMALIRSSVPDLERLVFEVFQPWEAGNYPLWALNKLDNLQKHQMLVTVLTTTSGAIDYITAEGVTNRSSLWTIQPGMVMEIQRSRRPLNVTKAPTISSELRFPKNVPFAGELVFDIVGRLYKLVRSILIAMQAHFEGGQSALADGTISTKIAL